MKIDFSYERPEKIEYISGDIYKGKNYRCNYMRFKSLYRNPAPGCENVHLYNYRPKGPIRASTIVLHGLGSRNIKFLLWIGPHLASVGVNTTLLILPGNYTRVEDQSVSGRSYLYPELETMYQFWENAVVDVLSTIDLLKELDLWKSNNLLLGYCLGGMVSSIVANLTDDIAHTIFMTTGGHIPQIMFESPAASFVPRMVKKGYETDYRLHDSDYLYKVYEEDLIRIKNMDLDEFLKSDKVHPLLKIDPLSYGFRLPKDRVTFVDAYFDGTLPKSSRKLLYDQMKGGKRKIMPITHVGWLPFSYFLAKYILHKVNIHDKKSRKQLLKPEKIETPLKK